MIGASAESQLVTHPNSSVSELIGLLGASMIDLRSHRDFAKLETLPSNPTKMGIKLTYNGQVRTFLPEQLVATVLKQLKKIVTEDAENKINGQNNFYVLSVPNYFTDVERHALLDAARYVSHAGLLIFVVFVNLFKFKFNRCFIFKSKCTIVLIFSKL